jgi:hypothetical protein
MQSLPPTLAAVVAEACQRYRHAGPGLIESVRSAWENDPASLKASTYGDLPKLRAALDEFDALPGDTPDRTRIAALLAAVCIEGSLGSVSNENLDRAVALADLASADPDLPLPWRGLCASVRSQATMNALLQGSAVIDPRAAIAEAEQYRALAESLPPEIRPTMVAIADAMLAGLTSVSSHRENDPGRAAENRRREEELRRLAASEPILRVPMDAVALLNEMQSAAERGDYRSALEGVSSLRALGERMPADHPTRHAIETGLESLELDLSIGAGAKSSADRWADVSAANVDELERLSHDPSVPDADRARHFFSLAMVKMQPLTREAADEAILLSEEGLKLSPPGGFFRARHLGQAGILRLMRWQMSDGQGDRADLSDAIELLEQAWKQALASGNHDVLLRLAGQLSQAYRFDGRLEAAHEIVVTALRGRVWSVMLQPRAADAHTAAHNAAEDAYQATGMFLRDGKPELAAWALEMGRGLIIHAATENRDAAAKLEARGEERLAREWREATATTPSDRIPSELRRRVISALAGVELAADGSLAADFDTAMALVPDPPSAHEIRAALTALDMDALVYLIPG